MKMDAGTRREVGVEAAGDGLVAALGRGDLTALIINTVIGSGIFGLPLLVTGLLGAVSPLGYVAAAAGIGFIALCFAEVGAQFRRAGGPYLYAREAFGGLVGAEVGWITWLMRISAAAATARIFTAYLAVFWPAADQALERTLLLTALFALLGWVNIRGVQAGARTSNVLTVAKLAPLAVFVAVGIWFVRGATFMAWRPTARGGWLEAILLLIFAFGGFDNAMFPASEMRDPRRDVPVGLLIGMGVVVVFYLAIQVVFQGVVPPGTVSAQPLAVAAGEFLGRAGAPLMAIGAMISIWGWFAATTLGTPRLTFAMAQHGDLPRQLAAVHPRFRTPHVSILLYVLASWALALAGNFEWNASLSAIARLATYGATCAALPVFRRRAPQHEATWTRPEQSGRALPPSEVRPQPDQREGVLRRAAVPLPVFRVPGGWAAPALGLGFCALLLSQMGRSDFLLLGATLVLGLGSWVAQRRRAD